MVWDIGRGSLEWLKIFCPDFAAFHHFFHSLVPFSHNVSWEVAKAIINVVQSISLDPLVCLEVSEP